MNNKRAFFISPFGKKNSENRKRSDFIMNEMLEPAFKPLEISVTRGEMITDQADIDDKIINEIVDSTFIIIDNAFYNPNVFFELGIAWTIGRPCIYLKSKINDDDNLPFNLSHIEHIPIPDNWSDYIYDLITFEKDKGKAISELNKMGKTIINNTYIHPKSGALDILTKLLYGPYQGKDEIINKLGTQLVECREELHGFNMTSEAVTEHSMKKELPNLVTTLKKDYSRKIMKPIIKCCETLFIPDPDLVIENCKDILTRYQEDIDILFILVQAYYYLSKKTDSNLSKENKMDANKAYDKLIELDPGREDADDFINYINKN